MLNIVIPMAGAGSRFVDAGYHMPKPLIEVAGTTMCELVYNNLKPACQHQFIFIVQQAHVLEHDIHEKLLAMGSDIYVITIDGLTSGAAATILKAKDQINNDNPLMIANCDQYIDNGINEYLREFEKSDKDGFIMTMTASDPKWSFARVNDAGIVTEVKEKRPISNEATVGIYNFKKGKDFVNGAEKMIKNGVRTNNEFYVAPVYNELISSGKNIGVFNVGVEHHVMHGLGTPEDLENFMNHPVYARAMELCK